MMFAFSVLLNNVELFGNQDIAPKHSVFSQKTSLTEPYIKLFTKVSGVFLHFVL
jgi:hypothetical protein